jgi:hypothetical protein
MFFLSLFLSLSLFFIIYIYICVCHILNAIWYIYMHCFVICDIWIYLVCNSPVSHLGNP